MKLRFIRNLSNTAIISLKKAKHPTVPAQALLRNSSIRSQRHLGGIDPGIPHGMQVTKILGFVRNMHMYMQDRRRERGK